ncbi:MAG: RloB family protein [Tissierellaceae bacterium]|nr:RloB family protein [Tissierellaceae bacterium]
MGLRIKKSLYKRHPDDISREPNKKIFVVCEGESTEIKYFEGIRDYSKELGISNLIELIIMKKDSKSKGFSNPNGLICLANDKINEFKRDNDKIYDTERDKFLIVFDRDKRDFKDYVDFIDKHKDNFLLGVTNPCFELWLLLHSENSVEKIIKPNYNDILDNGKVSNNHTFISSIVSNLYHMNPKRGIKFSKFASHVLYAIEQEKNLEQDLYKLEDTVGSNIGEVIEKVMMNK